jgi:hypothetical protein
MFESTSETWAARLKSRRDYRALAAVFSSKDYSEEFEPWKKRELAKRILLQAGSEAVTAILQELETGGVGRDDLAQMLVTIGDPRAVPLLEREMDRGEFTARAGLEESVRHFVEQYPHLHEPEEIVQCAICAERRPVTETRFCYGDDRTVYRFCRDACWGRRGEILGSKLGEGCPFYSRGMCTAGDGDHLCSLRTGSYATSCAVYEMQAGTAGLRTCASCGTQWRSMHGAMKDTGIFGPRVRATYNPTSLLGLTCTRCGKSYCRRCIVGNIPTVLPGGSCAACGAPMDLA